MFNLPSSVLKPKMWLLLANRAVCPPEDLSKFAGECLMGTIFKVRTTTEASRYAYRRRFCPDKFVLESCKLPTFVFVPINWLSLP